MKKILLVDDEYAFVENLTELLQAAGYRVVSAGNGQDGLARLQKEMPDLVITDLMMPIADGRELIRGMRSLASFRIVPVIMMSATTKAVALSDESGSLEISVFLKKPFSWETLLGAVTTLIGRGESSQLPT